MDTNNTGNAFMQMTVIGAAAIRRVGRAPVMSGHADAPWIENWLDGNWSDERNAFGSGLKIRSLGGTAIAQGKKNKQKILIRLIFNGFSWKLNQNFFSLFLMRGKNFNDTS